MKFTAHLISISLIGGGMAVLAATSQKLHSNPDMPVNVLGLKQSPYGEVIAMAMQGPIDNYWHEVASNRKKHVCNDTETCQHEHGKSAQPTTSYQGGSWNHRLRLFLGTLSDGLEERTNAYAASDAHKFYLRRQIEDKLRFAYELDPAHYGNYNAYHFFLTQPKLGTRQELTPHAAKLATETIQYCLSRRVDPRESLTAAAAAGNVLELMLNDQMSSEHDAVKYTTEQMRGVLSILDQSIAHFRSLSAEWEEQGLWANLSELRIMEAQERLRFVEKVRDTQAQSIRRIENESSVKFDSGSEASSIDNSIDN